MSVGRGIGSEVGRFNRWVGNEWLRFSILFVALFPLVVAPFFYLVYEACHSLGSEAGYQYWAANHFQWGTEIIQNIGPLGFIHFPLSFAGFLEYEKTLINFVFAGVLVSLVIFVSGHIQNKVMQMIFLVGFALMNNLLSMGITEPPEVNHYLMCLLIAYALFLSRHYLTIFFLISVLALMSLGKGMFLFISPVIILLASFNYFLQKRILISIVLPAIYVASILIFWVLAGQHLSNFIAFLQGSVAFSSGYNDAMANYDSPLIFTFMDVLFFLIAFGTILAKNFLAIIQRSRTESGSGIILAFIEMFILFAVYKHGIVASDDYHVVVLLLFSAVSFIPFLFIRPVCNRGAVSTQKYNVYDTAAAVFFLIAVICFCSGFSNGLEFVFNFKKEISIWDHKLENNIAEMQMPESQNIVKKETVGYFGELPAPMMYNNFHYKASPATISFATWNHHLMELDTEFYRNDGLAPSYLIYQLYNSYHQGIVPQFSPQDDSKAQLEIFRRYNPVLDSDNNAISEIGRLLLKRRTPISELQYKEAGTQSYTINQWIMVPEGPENPIQVIIKLQHSITTKIISMLYRSPGYYIEYKTDDGNMEVRKFISTTAEEGFLVAPLFLRNDDLLAVLSAQEWQKYVTNNSSVLRRMSMFRIVCDRFSFHCADKMDVTFRKVHGLEFGRIQSEIH